MAFASTLSRDNRTSFGLPLEPEVLISNARSGWTGACQGDPSSRRWRSMRNVSSSVRISAAGRQRSSRRSC
ncbi:unannotated protein [freshwater metagenome]|uniref:Unannotated protein n=1 Tax=freshwater metagenome TaxID=449393 RepID=A0A6J6FXB3_9ZZZZ